MIDLGDYLEELDKAGELLTVNEEVNWNQEVGAFSSMSNRAGGQAIHFTKLTGYPEGCTLASNLFGGPGTFYEHKRTTWGRLAIGLGLDPKIDYEALTQTIIERQHHPILPVEVSAAPCKEVKLTGHQINLFKFPLPLLHREDGGRYGTGHVLILKDPESDWQNWGVYRWKAVGPNTLATNFDVGKDAKAIYKKYAAQGKPMPFAIVVGGAPAILMASATSLPPMISAAAYAGGLNLDPINIIKAETSGIFVPADAEIVIEGETVPNEFIEEGPFGSIVGYTKPSLQPLMKVTAITHKEKCILPVIVDGTKVSDTQIILSMFESVRIFRDLVENNQYPVNWVNVVPDFGLGLCVIAVKNMYPGLTFRIARSAFTCSNFFDKLLFVDAEVVPIAGPSILAAISAKTHAARDIHFLHGLPPTLLNRYVTEEAMEKGGGAGRVYMEGCWPAHWSKSDLPMPNVYETVFSKEIREVVRSKWKDVYGFKEEIMELPEGKRFEF